MGRTGRDRVHSLVRALLQHLGGVRLPVLPRLSSLYEGRGRVRLEDLRHHHDDDRDRFGRVSIRENRALPDRLAWCHPAAAR